MEKLARDGKGARKEEVIQRLSPGQLGLDASGPLGEPVANRRLGVVPDEG